MFVDTALYIDGIRQVVTEPLDELLLKAKESDGFIWIGLAEPTVEEFQKVVGELKFHPLAVEDAIHAKQRPKIEEYEGLTLFIMKTVFFDRKLAAVTTGDLICFVSRNFIVSVRHGEGTPLVSVRRDLESKPELMKFGPFSVLHAILDSVIDCYVEIAGQLEQEVESLETKVFSERRQTFSQEIYFLKREFIEFRHAIEPLLIPVQKLTAEFNTDVPVALRPFFRDTNDHLMQAIDQASGLDSLVVSVLQADLAHVQVQQNIDVRKISAWVALASGPTMIAGIYGMNFHHMPELSFKYGYFVVLGVMGLLTGFLVYKFRKAKWL